MRTAVGRRIDHVLTGAAQIIAHSGLQCGPNWFDRDGVTIIEALSLVAGDDDGLFLSVYTLVREAANTDSLVRWTYDSAHTATAALIVLNKARELESVIDA